MGTGREVDGSRGGRKHARPTTQNATADPRRSACPQPLAGHRALEPQQNLRTGPQDLFDDSRNLDLLIAAVRQDHVVAIARRLRLPFHKETSADLIEFVETGDPGSRYGGLFT